MWYKTKTRSVKSKRGASTGIIKHWRGHFELPKIGFFEGGANQSVQEGGYTNWLYWHFSVRNNEHLIFNVGFLYLQGRVYCRGAVHRDQGGGGEGCFSMEPLKSWGYVSITPLHNPHLSWTIECKLSVAFSRFCCFSVLFTWNTLGLYSIFAFFSRGFWNHWGTKKKLYYETLPAPAALHQQFEVRVPSAWDFEMIVYTTHWKFNVSF